MMTFKIAPIFRVAAPKEVATEPLHQVLGLVLEVSTEHLEDGERPEVQAAVEELPVAPGDRLQLSAGGEGLSGCDPGL